MIALLLLLGCPDGPTCGEMNRYDDPECPCATRVYMLTGRTAATCRADQRGRIEWEPQNGPRTENEDRVGGVLICECVE